MFATRDWKLEKNSKLCRYLVSFQAVGTADSRTAPDFTALLAIQSSQ